MFRLIKFIIEIAILGIIIFWFVQNPGTLSIEWMDYNIETSIGIAALISAITIFICIIIHGIYRKVVNFPEKWKEAKKQKQVHLALDLI